MINSIAKNVKDILFIFFAEFQNFRCASGILQMQSAAKAVTMNADGSILGVKAINTSTC